MSARRGAVIGCGFFAQNHLKAWADVRGVELVAVCDVDPAKAEAAARLTGAPGFTDAPSLLASAKPDFVDIATTMETHQALVQLAADAGAHVVCQKPLAPDIATVRQILASAEAAGIRIMVHENFRFQTPLMALQRAIADGGIGRPFHAHISWRTGYDVIAGQPYLAHVERFILLDLGIHLFDVARFLLGDVRDLYARTQNTHPGARGEASAIISMAHANGATSQVACAYTTRIDPDPFPQTLIEVDGTEGSLRLGIDYRLEHHRRGSMAVREVAPKRPLWADSQWALVQESVLNTQQHFADCLNSGAEFQTSGRDNLKTFALVEAAYASAASGQPEGPEA